LRGKHCCLIVVSQYGGEKSALRYLSRVVQHLGGYDRWQIGLQSTHVAGIDNDIVLKEIIERETEDFYRAAHQNRRYVVPQDYVAGTVVTGGSDETPVLPDIASPTAQVAQAPLNEQHEKDIEELSRLFSQKFGNNDNDIITTPAPRPVAPVFRTDISDVSMPPSPPRAKTAKQITQSLPHYFQPQLSAGLQAVIQLSISGAETFEGFLYIHSTECTYTEGAAPAPDVTIIADSGVWMDVLKCKQTAQKAFMMGGLKVRGDFVLLTKFDQWFSPLT